MSPHSTSQPPAKTSAPAFSLVEIVIALTLVALITAVTVPTVSGIRDEAEAREPLAELFDMAKEARRRAKAEGRPYQITFTEEGFRATRYFSPYTEVFDIDEYLTEASLRRDEEDTTDAAYRDEMIGETLNDAARRPGWVGEEELDLIYELPDDCEIAVHYWGQATPETIENPLDTRPWVFQPNGLCNPVRVQFTVGARSFAATFNALTANIDHEKTDVE